MPSAKRIYLDTNTIIALMETIDGVAAALGDLLRGQDAFAFRNFVTSELTLAESLVRPFKDKNDELIASYEILLGNNSVFRVIPIRRDILRHPAELRAFYPPLKLPDAIHVATAFHFNCTHLLSDDKRLRENYTYLNKNSNNAWTLHVICPDIGALESLLTEFSA